MSRFFFLHLLLLLLVLVVLLLVPGDLICVPVAVCKPESEEQTSMCGMSNPCQGSFQLGFFQLCVEQLEDAEVIRERH